MPTLPRLRPRTVLLLAAAAALVALVATIEDWRRDFTAHAAETSISADDPRMRPLVTEAPLTDAADAVRLAAERLRGFHYVGQSQDGATVRLILLRTSRVWRLEDDIAVRVEEANGRRVIHADSRARFDAVGDLGRNPRNLRALLTEVESILTGL